VAPQKRRIIILLTAALVFGGAIMLRPVPSTSSGQALSKVEGPAYPAANGSGSKNPGFDANSSLAGQRDSSAKLVPSAGSGQALSKVEGAVPDQVGDGLGRGELFLKMMFSVVLVLVLGAAAVYMSKKVLPRITNLPGKEIRILETAHLGPRKAVHLLRIGNQRLLIGSTNESITMLADVTEQDEPDFVDSSSQQIDACVRK
jgi:flagellar protein FliO/FliZ